MMHDHGIMLAAGAGDLALAGVLLAAGLIGGMTHCTLMCGPFVLAQVTAQLDDSGPRYGTLARLSGAALAPYHLGRATTYVALGALGGALSGQAAVAVESRWLMALLLAAAGVSFLLWAIDGLGRARPTLGIARAIGDRLATAIAPLLGRPTGPRGYALGVALGFLPCGMLYGALAASAGSGSAAGGALAMTAFVGGTMVPLVALGYAGAFFGRRWLGAARSVAPVLMAANGLALLWFAWRTIG